MTAIPDSLLPPHDADRLRSLDRYQLTDGRREKVLDEVVVAAARLFRVAGAMLSIVEETTVLIKAPHNLLMDVERIPREQSLCSATILQHDTVVFEDLRKDSAADIDTSLILQLGLCFYAGHNLRGADGHNLGTLCLFDPTPRPFAAAERQLLGQLARLVIHLLELRRLLGPHAGLTTVFWEAIYRSMSEQLNKLLALADTAERNPAGLLSPAAVAEASSIVDRIDQLVAATLRY